MTVAAFIFAALLFAAIMSGFHRMPETSAHEMPVSPPRRAVLSLIAVSRAAPDWTVAVQRDIIPARPAACERYASPEIALHAALAWERQEEWREDTRRAEADYPWLARSIWSDDTGSIRAICASEVS